MKIMQLKKIEKTVLKSNIENFRKVGLSLIFIVAVLIYNYLNSGGLTNNIFLAIASVFGAYMAMNIGANDVANNVGPAVGSKALTMGGAILIAVIFEASGALIAGGDVVKTIKKGIIDIDAFNGHTQYFIWAMMAALLAAALWLNFATIIKAPVSTTHSIVGGVMGAGIAASGFSIVSWSTMAKIASSWIISPLLGGIIAAIFLFSIKHTIVFKDDKIKAATIWVPVFVAIMSWAFVTYLTLKGLKKIWPHVVDFIFILPDTNKPSFFTASIIGFIVAFVVYFLVRHSMKKNVSVQNSREGVNILFTVPLIFSAALLSFAHGANDVANAIGPLAAINDAVVNGGISSKAQIPLWVMGIGAIGIAIGLALYGPKLIRTVGSEITELDQMRAFSVAMAASITVIIASQLGLPVSSTHIAIGGIFGVGFLREYLDKTDLADAINDNKKSLEKEKNILKSYAKELKKLEKKDEKKKKEYQRIAKLYSLLDSGSIIIKKAKKQLKTVKKVEYVKRETVKKIIAAWIITVPAAAFLSAAIFFMIKGMVL